MGLISYRVIGYWVNVCFNLSRSSFLLRLGGGGLTGVWSQGNLAKSCGVLKPLFFGK